MAKINISAEKWSDIVLMYLLDSIKKKKVMESASPEFKEFMSSAKQMIRPHLVKHFLDMDPEMRVKYRLIRDAFTKGARSTVDILPKKFSD